MKERTLIAVLPGCILMPVAIRGKEVKKMTGITIASPAFPHMAATPARYTCDGQDINPPLKIVGVGWKAGSEGESFFRTELSGHLALGVSVFTHPILVHEACCLLGNHATDTVFLSHMQRVPLSSATVSRRGTPHAPGPHRIH